MIYFKLIPMFTGINIAVTFYRNLLVTSIRSAKQRIAHQHS
ncbi:hypothetical protein SPWS13_3033 [Shewanella putrefaciens]|nr:hypothetical protein SPWS13_3033 [Shewanella putrefaciens]